MAENSAIQWTDHTFNPWIGCTKVSPGCDHCYAEAREDKRLHRVQWGPGRPRHRTQTWGDPVKWNKKAAAAGVRARVFCASLADVFDNEVPEDWRHDLFSVIRITPNLDWLLLTKRIGNADYMLRRYRPLDWPWPNVWLGATVVNQEEADRDIPKLLATPAAVRFLSIEPILGEIDLNKSIGDTRWIGGQRGCAGTTRGEHHHDDLCGRGIDWVIVGGESGPKARRTILGNIEHIVEQCKSAAVPVFVKQLGRHPYALPHPLQHPKGGDMDEWPESLRVRQFPTTAGAVS